MSKPPAKPPADDVGQLDPAAARELLRELLASSKAAALILTAELQPVWCNRACETLLGEERSALLDRDVREVWDGSLRRLFHDPQSFVDAVLGSYAQGTYLEGLECRLRSERGERFVEYSSRPISSGPYEGGRIEIFSDVTAERQLEDQLLQARKMEAVGRLAGGVAHDFNNVLTAINGYSQLLAQMISEGRQHNYVEEIRKAGRRAAEMTANLMRISRRQLVHPQIVEPARLIRDLRSMLQQMIGEDVALETRLAPDLGHVGIDPGHMEQMILNLAINARDAMPSGGSLEIEASNVELERPFREVPAGSYVRLTVTDTGTGMEPEVLEHIFEPLFTTKEKGKGTGFGLATVYATVTRSDGYIHVDSFVGQGTTFRIFLPRVDRKPATTTSSAAAAKPQRGDERVLLVEDDDAVRTLVRELLEQQGYTVLTAKDAAEALAIVDGQSCPLDLLVSDVVMPVMSGPDLARRLVDRCPEMKILFISGYTDSFISHHGLSRARHVVLQKPFDAQVLAERVREVLDDVPTP